MTRPGKPVVLEQRLTRRMIQVQAVAILLFFGAVVFPLAISPVLNFLGPSRPLDPANTTIFAEAIRLNPDGSARVELTPKLQDLIKQYPEVWFLATTQTGVTASLGEIPAYYHQLGASLWSFEAVDVRPDRTRAFPGCSWPATKVRWATSWSRPAAGAPSAWPRWSGRSGPSSASACSPS